MGRSTFYRLFILDMENPDVSVLCVQCPTEDCAIHRMRQLLHVPGFCSVLIYCFWGISSSPFWGLLNPAMIIILGSHYHHSFFKWLPYKNPQQEWSSQRTQCSIWYFSSSKITASSKGFVWFLRLCTVTYFRSLYLVYIFVPCSEPKFSFSQIHSGPPGYHTSTIITTPPSLTFISSKALWVIIITLFSIYSCHSTKLHIGFV